MVFPVCYPANDCSEVNSLIFATNKQVTTKPPNKIIIYTIFLF